MPNHRRQALWESWNLTSSLPMETRFAFARMGFVKRNLPQQNRMLEDLCSRDGNDIEHRNSIDG